MPTVSRRIKLNKRLTLNSNHVSKRYNKTLFYTKSSKEQYKDTYIFDNKKLETQETKDLKYISQCQINCIDFILNIEFYRVTDMTRYDIDIHHMAMRSLGEGNSSLNLIPLEIPIHVKVHLAYAMLFDNHEVLLAASFMIYRGPGRVVCDKVKQLATRETFQNLFEDDSDIEAIPWQPEL